MKKLTIGQLAYLAGVNVATIRYYERYGLISKPARSGSGYRLYTPDFVIYIHFIVKAKALGFTLKEIAELTDLQINPEAPCINIKKRVAKKIEIIAKKIQILQETQLTLQKLHNQCRGLKLVRECPILKSFR